MNDAARMRLAFAGAIALSLASLIVAVGAGSAFVSPREVVSTLARAAFVGRSEGGTLAESIVLDLRLPRALLAFAAGAAFSVCGAIMQSVLRNSLASPFTLGVSSGASLGAGAVILYGARAGAAGGVGLALGAGAAGAAGAAGIAGIASLVSVPLAGFLASLATIAILLKLSRAIDPSLEGTTVILAGMVLSLFLNAALSLLSALSKGPINRLLAWQMGSFALKGWTPLAIVSIAALAGCAAAFFFRRELDILSFGDDAAFSIGVHASRARAVLTAVASLVTGTVVSFTGVIGFVDLAVPHLVRRVAGPSHATLIPLSALLGGSLMTLADLVARVAIPPLDLPVGAVTAALGAPFFAYVFLASKRGRS